MNRVAAQTAQDEWQDPFRPTEPGSDSFTDMIDALRRVQEAATRSNPSESVAVEVRETLDRVTQLLSPFEVAESDQVAGKYWRIAGRGQALAPVLHIDSVGPDSAIGHVEVGRFFSGRHALNGGVTPLIFDEMLSRFANTLGINFCRTAYLNVSYRSLGPLSTSMTVRCAVERVVGRKRFVRGTMTVGSTLIASCEGLWIEVREEQ
nr:MULTISPECIES: PaaI family thioesterase [unclassified Rhodococcus (in: high G+C Gram-positive bacteria)]